jgi:hypothetical protein
MGRKEIETLDRVTWAVWDSKHGIVADVVRLSKTRWHVEDYNSATCSIFRTQGQAIHYANQLPDPADVSGTQ